MKRHHDTTPRRDFEETKPKNLRYRFASTRGPLAYFLSSMLIAAGMVVGAEAPAYATTCASGTTSNTFSGGDGQSAGTAWQIANVQDLVRLSELTAGTGGFASFRDDFYKQTADINMAGCNFTPIGFATQITLHYDGGGHTIDGLTINLAASQVGMFAWLQGGGVRHLGLTNVDVTGQQATGGLIGRYRAFVVAPVVIEGVVVTGRVTGNGSIGVGGLVGTIESDSSRTAEIRDSYANVLVTNNNTATGGLVGRATATGTTRILNTHSVGLVTSPSTFFGGGLVGFGGAGVTTTTESFWDTETSLRSTSFSGTGKTTTEMTDLATFSLWGIADGWEPFNFAVPTNYWGICSGVNSGYPFLLWEYTTNPCASPSSSGAEASTPAVLKPALHLDLQATVGNRVTGSSVLMEGEGLQPGSPYALVVRSSPIAIKSGLASTGGRFSHFVVLPSGLSAGSHTITLSATGRDGQPLSLTQSFSVDTAGGFSALGSVSSSDVGGLAATGISDETLRATLGPAALFFLVGIALVALRRRAQLLRS